MAKSQGWIADGVKRTRGCGSSIGYSPGISIPLCVPRIGFPWLLSAFVRLPVGRALFPLLPIHTVAAD